MNKVVFYSVIMGGLGMLPGLTSVSHGMEENPYEELQSGTLTEEMVNPESNDAIFEDKFAKYRVEIPTNYRCSPLVYDEENDQFSFRVIKSGENSESDGENPQNVGSVLQSDLGGNPDSESDSDSSSSHDYLNPKWDDYLNVFYNEDRDLFYFEDSPSEKTPAERISHLMHNGLSFEKAQAILIARGIIEPPVNLDPVNAVAEIKSELIVSELQGGPPKNPPIFGARAKVYEEDAGPIKIDKNGHAYMGISIDELHDLGGQSHDEPVVDNNNGLIYNLGQDQQK